MEKIDNKPEKTGIFEKKNTSRHDIRMALFYRVARPGGHIRTEYDAEKCLEAIVGAEEERCKNANTEYNQEAIPISSVINGLTTKGIPADEIEAVHSRLII